MTFEKQLIQFKLSDTYAWRRNLKLSKYGDLKNLSFSLFLKQSTSSFEEVFFTLLKNLYCSDQKKI